MQLPFRAAPARAVAATLLVLSALPSALAVYKDEVGHIDFHHELVGVPSASATLFHRPRRDVAASLLYTLSDVGVLGAVSPKNGTVKWRQLVLPPSEEDPNNDGGATDYGDGHLRAGDGESWLASALGGGVAAWDAWTGRSVWSRSFLGKVVDLEILELTASAGESGRKDVLALFDEGGATVLRRLRGGSGNGVWQFRDDAGSDLPLQVGSNGERVFVVSLHGSGAAGYNIKLTALDPATGKKLEEAHVGSRGEIKSARDVVLVGANSAAPIVAWTDAAKSTIKVHVLGSAASKKHEFPLAADTTAVYVHAPQLVQSRPHFLVHAVTRSGHKGEVFHVDLKSGGVVRAYELAHLPGHGAFSTSSEGSNVYFTRLSQDEVVLLSSESHGVLAKWPAKSSGRAVADLDAVHAVSEVVKKAKDSYAVRSAFVDSAGDWALVQNGEVAWTRPESMTGAVAAAWAEIPESEELARTLEAEAHSNPLSAYVHRVQRHIKDLQHLPAFLEGIPKRLMSSILGTELPAEGSDGVPARDSFGLSKLVILATKRGRIFALDVGNRGRIVWSTLAFSVPADESWAVKGIFVEDAKSRATVMGTSGEYVVVRTDSGKVLETMPVGSHPPLQATVVVDSAEGTYLLPVGLGGKIDDVPAGRAPKQTVVVKGPKGEMEGLTFLSSGAKARGVPAWTFVPAPGQKIVAVGHRPPHDPIASIGRVLGDRTVKYKYLNPNTMVVAAADASRSTLTLYLVDTVSGQVLLSSAYEGTDVAKPVSCAIVENWFACTFFGEYFLRDAGPAQVLKGWQLAVADLYESEFANDRGQLGSYANYSSLDPIDVPTGPIMPAVESQTYIISSPLAALAVTQTRQGITSKLLLAYLPEQHGIVGIPRAVMEPRRPVGRDPTAQELEEGLARYHPVIEMDPKSFVTHELQVLGVRDIITSPSILESTSLVLAFGIDVFGTRVTPSLAFDILGKGFNKITLIGTVLALVVGVVAVKPMVRRRLINNIWETPL